MIAPISFFVCKLCLLGVDLRHPATVPEFMKEDTVEAPSLDPNSTEAKVMSAVADKVPGVSNVKSAVEAVTGEDMYTKEKLSIGERVLSAVGAVGGAVVKGVKSLLGLGKAG